MACSSSPWTKVVDLSNVAIGKLSQAALELNVNLDLLVGDAAEYKFEPTRFDLIVLFYHLDRNLFPKMVAALKPGGMLIFKMSLQWDLDGGLTSVSANPLGRNELLLLVPELHVLYQEERPVRGSGRCRVHWEKVWRCGRRRSTTGRDQCIGPANSTSVSRLRPVKTI